ncbi:MFS general substrate transporter [Gloeophyllum trabeum ATCC 11539]|uniref:MFS general substrate transporter n=1 Tax=Gloeophyllum trabeum (strain ATCC 11539 / FP-39264 / Madison 617) TaxID=670483 RepID=S7QLA2_GLOTA|nr:MFS general substrate transporter [Gloeophyllum trabeum ATCC 11539]EPQ60098.1 MFS general substrate transporter [Gloeophyllum trabeum ATCC 11539]
MIFQVIGINSIYGIFQEMYTSPRSTVKDAIGQDAFVSLVGSIGTGLTWSGGIVVNPLIARTKDVRWITVSGVVIMSLGLILASFSTRLWHLFLTQALLYGIGSSAYYFPIISLTPPYFDRHRGFAMGVILSGSGIGGLVLAPVLRILLDRYGVGWTLRILGLWNLAVGLPTACVIRKKASLFRTASGSRPVGQAGLNMNLVKRGAFLWQSLGAFLQASGNVVPLYYMTTYSTSILSYSSSAGSLLLAMNNAVNSVSRVLMGVIADRVGRQNTMILSVFLSGLSVFAFWYDASRVRFLLFVVSYGIYAGGYNALVPTTIAEIYGVENYSSVNGVIYFIRGLGAIFGAPIAGVILGSHQRSGSLSSQNAISLRYMMATLGSLKTKYNEVVIYDGVLLLSAAFCVLYVRWLDARDKGGWSWRA